MKLVSSLVASWTKKRQISIHTARASRMMAFSLRNIADAVSHWLDCLVLNV